MIKVKQYDSYGALLWVTPMMEKLVQHVQLPACQFSVGLVPAGYYATNQEASRGPCGYAGPRRPEPRPNFKESTETLVCQMVLLPTFEKDIDTIKSLASQLQVTIGGRDNKLEPLKIRENMMYEKRQRNYYYYKKPGFDDVFRGLHTIDPTFQEKDMIDCKIERYYCYEFSLFGNTLTPTEDQQIFKTVTETYDYCVGIKDYTVTLEIIATDIESQCDKIVTILQQWSIHV